ncbi:hypothetical protein EV401DRAFT_635198 [Pisolithus croceorrhizus]|nr:hypothetical protein EV401DRAFT_635198 [Pisolithus croceorrhizus]
MLDDPSTYSGPTELDPDRFLPVSVLVSIVSAPSVQFVWICVAMSLVVFEISKVVENGVEITLEVDPSYGTIGHLELFNCSAKARSAKVVELTRWNFTCNSCSE